MLPSRAVRRSPKFMQSAAAARSSFSQISASRRRISRKKKLEAAMQARLEEERMSVASGTTAAGTAGRLSPASTATAAADDQMRKNIASIEDMARRAENQGGEGALKNALRTTLDSLRAMQK